MPIDISARDVHQFDPRGYTRNVRVRRQNPVGPADFVVYDTANTSRSLGAGSCPALPNYVEVEVPANVAFSVQSLTGDIHVDNY